MHESKLVSTPLGQHTKLLITQAQCLSKSTNNVIYFVFPHVTKYHSRMSNL